MKRGFIHIFHRVFHRFWGPKAPFGGVFHGYAPAGTVNCYIFSTDHSLIWSYNKRNQSVLRRFCGVDGLIFVIFVDFCPVNGYLHNAAGGEKMKNQAVYFTNVLHFQVFDLYTSSGHTVPDSVLPVPALQRQKMPPRMPYANMRSDGRAFKSSAAVSPRIRR